MKAVSVCVAFAAVCVMLAMAEQSSKILILKRTMSELRNIQKGLVKNSALLHSPTTNDLKDCCVAATLECFRSQVFNLTTRAKISQKIVSNELRKSIIVNAVSTCKPEETQKAQCKSCESHQEMDGLKFVHNFQALLQRINSSQK